MARKMAKPQTSTISVDLGRPNSDAQIKFFTCTEKYVNYGGARGGGKTWAVRVKAVGGAIKHAGIKILIMRRTYPELENTLIEPIKAMVPAAIGQYNSTMHTMFFVNGSIIKFGHLQSYNSIVEYQGQEWDWIFMDEATHFTESEFRALAACVRGVNSFSKRMFLTCNPGGIGHNWVKRIFVTRNFNPKENPKDYIFIPATVEDNVDLIKSSPDYVTALELLPEDIYRAHRFGDWDALAGTFFPEFTEATHVYKPFPIPDEWMKYRVFDYGLDMFACLWIAVDFDGRCWVYREVGDSDLIVSQAGQLALDCTPANEHIQFTIAPPDMWSTQKDTGRTMAEIFTQCGLGLVKANNSRIQGWMALKELLKPMEDGKPGFMVSSECTRLIDHLPSLQHSDKNPSDVATEPHDITHFPDAARYFAQFRTMKSFKTVATEEWDEPTPVADYDEEMCGGVPDASYLSYSA